MQQYIIKRILLFIPSLFLISVIAFIINTATPGDPVRRLMAGEADRPERNELSEQRYLQLQHSMGLDLPLFYISLRSLAAGDFRAIPGEQHRKALKDLASYSGNPSAVLSYYKTALERCRSQSSLCAVLNSGDPEVIDHIYNAELSKGSLSPDDPLIMAWNELKSNISPWKKFIPVVRFHYPNQYHRWIFGDGNWLTGSGAIETKGIIRGDFGKSYVSGKKVGTLLKEKSYWTIFFSLGGLLLASLISIPAGVVAGSRPFSAFDKVSNAFLMTIHSLPSFFIATCLLMLFANTAVFAIFPASGIAPAGYSNGSFAVHLPYIILPMAAYVAGTLPFLTRTIRSGIMDESVKDYVLTARAKGLGEAPVLLKHIFRNSLLPLITIIAYAFPAMIGGSAILETVFSIPGLGLEIVHSVFNRDYPVIVAVFTITGLLTVTGFLVGDVLYALADPKIRFA